MKTGEVSQNSLINPRLQLHYGALILGSTADSLLEAVDDDSQTNLGFHRSSLSFESHALDGPGQFLLRLEIPTLTLELRQRESSVARYGLAGNTMTAALSWVEDQLGRVCGFKSSLSLREYPGFPESPLATGAVFDAPATRELTEIAHWFANGWQCLEALRDENSSMSALRVWPHHLDLGGLIPLPGGSDHMIGLGLSPGDGYYNQPYFYCTPYPSPGPEADRPAIPIGHWHTVDFVSAIATATEIHASPSALAATQEYFVGAISACRDIVR